MKKTRYNLDILLLLLVGFVLAGCVTQPAAQPTTNSPTYSGALEAEYENALDAIDQLALGTIRLDQTQHAVTEVQATDLLPLWQSLQGSDLQGDAERYAVARLIEATMNEAQVSEIAAMQLTQADAITWMQNQGNEATDTSKTQKTGNGQRAKDGTGNMTEEQIATRQARFAQQGGAKMVTSGANARFLSNAVVTLLRERSGATIVQAITATPTERSTNEPTKIEPTLTATQEATATLEPTREATATPTAEPAQKATATPTPKASSEQVAAPTATPNLATPVPVLSQIEDTDPGPPFAIEISLNTATQDPLVTDSQRYHITGLVRNDGNQTYAVSALYVTFFDAEGFRGSFQKAPGKGRTGGEWVWHGQAEADFACLLLAPGEVCPFSIEITAQNMASFLIHPDGVATDRESIELDLNNVQLGQNSTDFVRITGTATNDSTVTVKNPTVVGALLDANGQMVGVGSVYVLQENIAPGESVTFDLRIEKEAFASYQLYAQVERDWN